MQKVCKLILLFLLVPALCFGGVDFDGVDDFIPIADIQTPSTAITLAAWAKFDQLPTTKASAINVCSKGFGGGQPFISYTLTYNISSTKDVPQFLLGVGGVIRLTTDANDDELDLDTWHFWIGKWASGGPLNIRVYDEDGTLVVDRSSGNVTGTIDYSTEDFSIGRGRVGDTNPADGGIDEVMLWSVQLTNAEGEELARSHIRRHPLQIQTSSLVGHWALDDVSDGTSADGATFIDMIGGNNGTGDDGGNNTGLTGIAGRVLTYP